MERSVSEPAASAAAAVRVIVVVMGVSGAGKSTVGQRLAEQLGWPFHDGDDLHPAANVARMRAGLPLTDADREPWLRTLEALIGRLSRSGRSAVIACSALKASYRERLRRAAAAAAPQHEALRFVHLRVSPAEARRRVAGRSGHYMPPELVPSQFEALEEPADAIVVESEGPIGHVVDRICAALAA